MKSPQDLALQRAQDFARDRGWRQDPLTWEEVEVLVELTFGPDQGDFETGYEEGYEEGRDAGYRLGYADGKDAGSAQAKKERAS